MNNNQFTNLAEFVNYRGDLTKSKLDMIDTFETFKDKPFYCWKSETDDCFNHTIGLPIKNGTRHALYDYEKIVYDELDKSKYLWIKKATGLGITEFVLRYMAWLAVYDYTYQTQLTQFCIVTGPNEDLAIRLIERFKRLFIDFPAIKFANDMKTADIGNVEIHAYPSNHLDSMRSLTNPKFILLDEADMFKPSEQQNARDVSERYIAKSDPWIVMISTPNRPDGLFATMEYEEPSIYKKLYFSYHYGLDKIYSTEEIRNAKRSPSFEREYNLKYLGKIGNVFPQIAIDRAIELGEQLQNEPVNQYTHHTLGLDPGFSKITPLYISEFDKEHRVIRIIHFEGFDNTRTPEQIANRIFELHTKFINLKCYIDGSNRGFINQLKTRFGEWTRWKKPEDVSEQMNKIVPVNFVGHHRQMLEHAYLLLTSGKIAIPKKYDRLITALRTAQAQDFNLMKEDTVNDDDLDCLRLMLIPFNYGKKQ